MFRKEREKVRMTQLWSRDHTSSWQFVGCSKIYQYLAKASTYLQSGLLLHLKPQKITGQRRQDRWTADKEATF